MGRISIFLTATTTVAFEHLRRLPSLSKEATQPDNRPSQTLSNASRHLEDEPRELIQDLVELPYQGHHFRLKYCGCQARRYVPAPTKTGQARPNPQRARARSRTRHRKETSSNQYSSLLDVSITSCQRFVSQEAYIIRHTPLFMPIYLAEDSPQGIHRNQHLAFSVMDIMVNTMVIAVDPPDKGAMP